MDWVVDFEREVEEKETSKVAKHWTERSIYQVPACTKDLHKNAFTPLAVSFGPYHSQQRELNTQMDTHKHRALHHFCKNSGKPLKTYVCELQPVGQRLMESYELLDAMWNPNTFMQLMLLDGCFMLEILRAYEAIKKPGNTYGSYGGEKDPIFSYHGKVYVMPHFRRDMLMLENQIPMALLVQLVKVENSIGEHQDAVTYLNRLILNFVNPSHSLPVDSMIIQSLHILDLYRKSLLGYGLIQPPVRFMPPNTKEDIVRSAEKLHQAGVEFKASETDSLKDISFDCGVLRLPNIVVDDGTESTFLNLMMFERLHVGTGNEITSYVSFMDNIIDSAKDVSLLHSAGILHTDIGSEKAVANLFNGMSKDVTPDPNGRLEKIHSKLNHYCNRDWNQHLANIRRNYFKNPWALVSLVAAIFLMILTIAQTTYSIISYHIPK